MKLFNGSTRVVPLAACVLVVGISLPYWLIPTQFALGLATLTALYAAAGICWNLVGGYGGQLSFGHSVYFGIGAYTTGLLSVRLGVSPWIGMFVGAALAAVAGAVTTYPALRLHGIYFALTTFVVALLFQDLAVHFRDFTGGDVGLSLPFLRNSPAEFQFADPLVYYYIAVALLALFLLAAGLIVGSRFGRFLRAIRDDDEAARATGVNVPAVKLIALTASAFGTGLVGAVFMQYSQFIDPATAFGITTLTLIALVALVGGPGTLLGPILGAAVLVPLQQYLSSSLSTAPSGTSSIAYGGLVILIISLDRRGIAHLLARAWRCLRKRPPRPGTSEATPGTSEATPEGGPTLVGGRSPR